MTDRAKKITELDPIGTTATSIASGDLFIVEDVSANATKISTMTTLRKNMVQGPYANDSAAGTGGVAVGEMYYTSDGSVKVRIA